MVIIKNWPFNVMDIPKVKENFLVAEKICSFIFLFWKFFQNLQAKDLHENKASHGLSKTMNFGFFIWCRGLGVIAFFSFLKTPKFQYSNLASHRCFQYVYS